MPFKINGHRKDEMDGLILKESGRERVNRILGEMRKELSDGLGKEIREKLDRLDKISEELKKCR